MYDGLLLNTVEIIFRSHSSVVKIIASSRRSKSVFCRSQCHRMICLYACKQSKKAVMKYFVLPEIQIAVFCETVYPGKIVSYLNHCLNGMVLCDEC